MFSFSSVKSAFTLLEMVMVIGIMAILVVVGVANYRVGSYQMELSSDTEKIGEIFKKAQAMSLTGEVVEGSRPSGYGVYLDQDNDEYTLFADLDGGNDYDSPDEKIQDFSFTDKVVFDSITENCATVIFAPPQGTVAFFGCDNDPGSAITVVLKHGATNQTKQIGITAVGRVNIPF